MIENVMFYMKCLSYKNNVCSGKMTLDIKAGMTIYVRWMVYYETMNTWMRISIAAISPDIQMWSRAL